MPPPRRRPEGGPTPAPTQSGPRSGPICGLAVLVDPHAWSRRINLDDRHPNHLPSALSPRPNSPGWEADACGLLKRPAQLVRSASVLPALSDGKVRHQMRGLAVLCDTQGRADLHDLCDLHLLTPFPRGPATCHLHLFCGPESHRKLHRSYDSFPLPLCRLSIRRPKGGRSQIRRKVGRDRPLFACLRRALPHAWSKRLAQLVQSAFALTPSRRRPQRESPGEGRVMLRKSQLSGKDPV